MASSSSPFISTVMCSYNRYIQRSYPSLPHIALSVQYHSMVIWNILRCDLKHSKTLHRHYTDIKQTLDRYQTDIRHQSRYHDRYEDRYEEWHRHTYKTDIKQKQYRYKGDTKETKRRHKGETKHNIKTDMQYVVHNSSIFTLFLVCWPYFWYVDHIYGMLTIILVFWPYFC